jgi:predicted outer membrane protein
LTQYAEENQMLKAQLQTSATKSGVSAMTSCASSQTNDELGQLLTVVGPSSDPVGRVKQLIIHEKSH